MAHRHNLSVDECLHNFAFHMYNDPNLTSIPHVLCLPCLQDCEWPWVRFLWVTPIWRKNWQSSWICIHFLSWKQPAQLERPRNCQALPSRRIQVCIQYTTQISWLGRFAVPWMSFIVQRDSKCGQIHQAKFWLTRQNYRNISSWYSACSLGLVITKSQQDYPAFIGFVKSISIPWM